ncbi:MarR family winged helix-turn-helix transcriptional regulator [Citricoccus sp. K5]|uniref:MarR family winged helix-turn-helix transcriptional regulator n=1 Tax=Citricoccus sp. K5 TaxID=2653135 RepID=UPI0012F11C10|nr:MarR family transcriptional regulator [Citricoccus sp. K5]VXB13344.1 DNA-binding MarR family transcriptional regulator [Citricoccus sp. K5]
MTSSSAETDAWSRTSAPVAHESGVQRQSWRAYFEATALLQDRLDRTLKDSAGLHLADYNLLLLLSEAPEGRLRMGELARLMVFSPSRVTYQVKTLEQRGLVERCAAATDRRGAEAVITDAGRHHFRKAAAVHSRQVQDLFLDRLEDGEAETLLRVFSRLGRTLEGGETATLSD